MKYDYINIDDNVSQYDDIDFGENKIIDARYIPAALDEDKGNPYIEALPIPRRDASIRLAYTRSLPSYRYEEVKSMNTFEKMLAVGALRKLRFPLPFNEELEFEFYNALVTSYRARKQIMSINSNVEYFSENCKQNSHSILAGDSADATNAGFSLIGYSGCGKSSAIKTLVSHYPQVIMHHRDEIDRFPQIVYLVVNCVANSNFAALYEGIGDAIDKALGNIVPVYAQEIAKTKSLGQKAEKVKLYIERFGVGIIVFDEIQLIDFSHTKENSFESLMTLSNRTKVAIAVVGTEDAKDKMFKELRTSRRVGRMIKGSTYCESKNYFTFLCESLFRYQWFDEPVQLTKDIVDALYDVTKGIVDQLIGIYTCMHYEYFRRKKKVSVTPEFIRGVANKYYPNMQKVLEHMNVDEQEGALAKIKMNAELKLAEMLDKEKQEQAEKKILDNANIHSRTQIQLSNVVSNISGLYDFTDEQIQNAFNKVMSRKGNEGKSEREISRLTLDILTKAAPKARTPSKKSKEMSVRQMKDFLGLSE